MTVEGFCEQRIFSGQRWDMRGHSCSKKAVVIEGGKRLCSIHSSEAVAKRKAKRETKWDAENAAQRRKWAVEAAERKVVAAALRWNGSNDGSSELITAIDALRKARAQ